MGFRLINLREDSGLDNEYFVMKDDIQFIVVDYESGMYDGDGESWALSSDGNTVFSYCNGHCSCYGPWGDLAEGTPQPWEEFIKGREQVVGDDECPAQVYDLFEAIRNGNASLEADLLSPHEVVVLEDKKSEEE